MEPNHYFQIAVIEADKGTLGGPSLDASKFDLDSCDAAFKPDTQNIVKAIACLQGGLAGKIGDKTEVRSYQIKSNRVR